MTSERARRRTLADIERRLVADDPRLDVVLRGPIDRTAVFGRRLGRALLWFGIVVLGLGVVLSEGTLIATGCVVLLTFWIPMRLRGSSCE